MSKPWWVCLTVETVRPRTRSNGISFVSRVVLPLPDQPTMPMTFTGEVSRGQLALGQAAGAWAGGVAYARGQVVPSGPQGERSGHPQHRLANRSHRQERHM